MSDQRPATITLVGRMSAWQQRLPAGPADRGTQPRPARADRPLTASWVHHHSYGTLGVYLAADAQAQALLRGQWVQIAGVVRPYLAYALPDDPRSVVDAAMTPLLIEADQIRPIPRGQRSHSPLTLTAARQARLLPHVPGGPAQIARLAQWGDAVYWRADRRSPAVSASWDTVRGVVTQLGRARYLRYVLSLRSIPPAVLR